MSCRHVVMPGRARSVGPSQTAMATSARDAVRRSIIRKGGTPKVTARRANTARLDRLIEEATVDAYNESEQAVGLFTMMDEHLAVPFATTILGVEVTVERVDVTDTDAIVAVCRRGRERLRVPILELPLPNPPPGGAEWIEAYRRWIRGR